MLDFFTLVGICDIILKMKAIEEKFFNVPLFILEVDVVLINKAIILGFNLNEEIW